MANPVLHIKDAYFFEVPKFAFQRNFTKPSEFPSIWLKLDPTVQHSEAEALAAKFPIDGMSTEESVTAWHDWTPNHHHAP
jgi:F-type H+-transporting ATPase subunit a